MFITFYFCYYYNRTPVNGKDFFMNFACKFPFLFTFFVKFNRNFWYISYEDNKKHDIFLSYGHRTDEPIWQIDSLRGASSLPAANSYLILNIPSGFSRPHPCLLFAIPQSTAFCIRRIFTSLFDSHGSLERSKAIVPDTIGVAIDVPLLFL